jgi:hypothetical protein
MAAAMRRVPIMTSILAALRRRFSFTEGEVAHDPDDMVFQAGNAPDALLYSLLFVPELSVVDGSVLLTNGDTDIEERFLSAKRETQTPLDRLEASFNFREIPFLFAHGKFENDDEEQLLAEKLAEAWRRALAAFAPSRQFAVCIVPAEENAGNIAVQFYERRSV